MFWSLRPEQAPRFWFWLLPAGWWIGVIFDGLQVVLAIQHGQITAPMTISSAVIVLLLMFVASPLLRFRRLQASAMKATSD